MCLPLDGNICFFLSMETESEKERRSREKVGDDGRKQVVLADHSAVPLVFKAWLSPHWANTVSVWSWYRLCGGKAGQDSVEFAGLRAPSAISWKITSHFSRHVRSNLSPCASKHKCKRAKHHLKLFCSEDKTLSGNKEAHIHTRTKQSRAENGTPISSKHSHPLSVHR